MPSTAPTQISRETYFSRVRAALPTKAEETPDDVIEDLDRRIGTQERIDSLRADLEVWTLDPNSGHDGVLEIYDLADVRAALARPGFTVCNWHYDRKARVLLLNLRRGVHEYLAGSLFNAYTGVAGWKAKEEAAERYCEEGFGWFMSTTSRRPLKGPNVVLDAQERMAFRDVEFRTLT